MLLALGPCFHDHKNSDTVSLVELHSSKGHKCIWYTILGYATVLIIALEASVLTHSPQPTLLYPVKKRAGQQNIVHLISEAVPWMMGQMCN